VNYGAAYLFFLGDCNKNDICDRRDIAKGFSEDCDESGLPDECECPADVTEDGQVTVDDIIALLTIWGVCDDPCPPYCCEGDLSKDCTVNIDDVFAILGQWGVCP